MNNKLFRLLNIHPEEAGIVSRLFAVQFFFIAGSSFLFITSNAIFLSRFPISELPAAFFITGIFLILTNKAYQWAEHLFTSRVLFKSVIIFSIAMTVVLALMMDYFSFSWMPYVLLVWYNMVYLLTAMIFWGLVSSVFDVRESRRLFTIIGAGDIPAKIIGYLSVPLLAPFIGLTNMIWITVALFIVAYWFSGKLFKAQRILNMAHAHTGHAHTHERHAMPQKKDAGEKLIVSIAFLSFVSFAALILIDFIFLAEVKTRYHEDLELAYFLGIFFAAGRVLAVFIKFLLSSRFINYAGLAGSLLLSPLLLLLFVAFILVSQYEGSGLQYLIYLYGIMALLTEILKATIQEPVFLILFQPLKLPLRLKGHVIAKGYMLSAALAITGGLLYLYVRGGNVHAVTLLLYILLAMIVVWMISIYPVKKQYVHNLHAALQRGYLTGNELFIDDKQTMKLLLQKAAEGKPSEALFALHLLEKAGYEELPSLFISVLNRRQPVLSHYVLGRIVSGGRRELVPHLLAILQQEHDPEMIASCLKAIARLDKGNPVFQGYTGSADRLCRDAAIEGLLLGKEDDRQSGIEKLDMLLHAAGAADRRSAAQIIGNCHLEEYKNELSVLLNDEDIWVRRSAMEACGAIADPGLIPGMAAGLKAPDIRKEAIAALTACKDHAIAYFEKHPDAAMTRYFIHTAGNLSSERSVHYLLGLLSSSPSMVSEVISQLRKKHFVPDEAQHTLLTGLLHSRLAEMEKIGNIRASLAEVQEAGDCVHALDNEMNERWKDALRLLPVIFSTDKVSRAVNILLKQHQKSSNALEMLEMSIPRALFQTINRLYEAGRRGHLPVKKYSEPLQELLKKIIMNTDILFNDWTRAMALVLAAEKKETGLYSWLPGMEKDFSPLLREVSHSLLIHS